MFDYQAAAFGAVTVLSVINLFTAKDSTQQASNILVGTLQHVAWGI